MIQTQPEDLSVYVTPISFLCELKVISGNTVQNYNQDTKEYVPSRALVPCLIMPMVSVYDPESMMNGQRTITGVDYYEGAPKADNSNKIITGTDYIISDTDCPTYSLKVKKNIPVYAPIEINAVIYFVDTRTNTEVNVFRSIALYTNYYDSKNYSVKLDQPKTITLNPLVAVENANGNWGLTLNAQLYSGAEAVADANAAYLWQVLENGTWREIDPAEDFFMDSPESKGTWGKSIIIDYRCFKSLSIRCLAKYYADTYPTSIDETENRYEVTINVKMPDLYFETRRTKGGKIAANLSTAVKFELLVFNKSTNAQVLGKNDFFQVTWKGKSSTAGSTANVLGNGMTIDLAPSQAGVTTTAPLSIWAEIKTYSEHYAIVDDADDTTYICDTDTQYPLIDKDYE